MAMIYQIPFLTKLCSETMVLLDCFLKICFDGKNQETREGEGRALQ